MKYRIISGLIIMMVFAFSATALTSVDLQSRDNAQLGEGIDVTVEAGKLRFDPSIYTPFTRVGQCKVIVESLSSPKTLASVNIGSYQEGEELPDVKGTLYPQESGIYRLTSYVQCENEEFRKENGRPYILTSEADFKQINVDRDIACVNEPVRVEITNIEVQQDAYVLTIRYENGQCTSANINSVIEVDNEPVQRTIFYDELPPKQAVTVTERIAKADLAESPVIGNDYVFQVRLSEYRDASSTYRVFVSN